MEWDRDTRPEPLPPACALRHPEQALASAFLEQGGEEKWGPASSQVRNVLPSLPLEETTKFE